jgi:sporulation protein YlmC with PRC-barrel domain
VAAVKKKLAMAAGTIMLAGSVMIVEASAQAPRAGDGIRFVAEQPAGEWLARVFLGAIVQNDLGETVGDVNDLMFDPSGRISTVVLGVGGFLGMGEKDVAVPYGALTYKTDKDGARIIVVALTKEALLAAPAFKATEKTTYELVKDKAVTLAHRASEAAGKLKDQAMKKVDDMKKDEMKKP